LAEHGARAARIREIAEKLNYRPNAAAKAVVTGRFGSIGLPEQHQAVDRCFL
jgi:DNA-binding LacI/PurR family transcriptional regulator